MQQQEWFVYIITNSRRTVFYIGMSRDVSRRWFQHYKKMNPKSFSARYNCDTLVYVETYSLFEEAGTRELQLKKWSRKKKIDLIMEQNPEMKDLMIDQT